MHHAFFIIDTKIFKKLKIKANLEPITAPPVMIEAT